MMKRTVYGLTAALILAFWAGLVTSAQTPLTPFFNLGGKVDSNGSLITTAAAYSGTSGPLTLLSNLRGKTDSNGYLITTVLGGTESPDSVCLDGTNQDTCLVRDGAADTLAQRRSTNSQEWRLYKQYTSTSDYQRASLAFTASTTYAPGGSVILQTAAMGRSAVGINFGVGGIDWGISDSHHFFPSTANSYDLCDATNTCRSGYFGTSVISTLFRSPSAKVLVQGANTGATQLAATQTTAPTCTSNCGTSPSVVGTDTFMVVTMGASGSPASGWVITFNGTWAAAPACTIQMAKAGMAIGKMVLTAVSSTTTLTAVTNGVAPANSDVYNVFCAGTQ